MKKIITFIVIFFTIFTTAYGYSYNNFTTCNTYQADKSYDYYFDTNMVKKYGFDKDSRKINKFCVYKDNGKEKILKNGETTIIKNTIGYNENYEKLFCDNGKLTTIFKWTKKVKMPCTFSVNNHKYVLQDGETKIIKNNYYNTIISQKFVCNNGKVKKVDEWIGKKSEKKSCYFVYNGKVYNLDHGAYTTIKMYEHEHLIYKKFVCDNGVVKDNSLWRNTYNDNSGREVTKNCRFIYRGKYYDLQDNGIKEFTTTVYNNGVKKVYHRTYYCKNGVAKIY